MKIVKIESVLNCEDLADVAEWKVTRALVYEGIRAVDWPPGSGTFTIYPQSGKKRGEGNGVKPIKDSLMKFLKDNGWKLEHQIWESKSGLGKLDACLETERGLIGLEWETGNISSSHRAINKILLGLKTGKLIAGLLVLPSRSLYRFLTDRIGNYEELVPYLDLWKTSQAITGIFELIVVEHDAESTEVPRIPKGTDGRALN